MIAQDTINAIQSFVIPACAGAVGGLVGGINTGANNTIRLMSWKRSKRSGVSRADEPKQALQIELGFIGDLLMGAAAGIAIMFFLNIAAGDKGSPDPFHMIPISLMVGVVSKKALVGMSEATVNKLFSETDKLRDEQIRLQAQVKKLDHVNELIQEGERYLQEAEEEKHDEVTRMDKYKSAQATFRQAAEFDEGHAKAYVGLGKVLKRLAGETQNPETRRRFYLEAIEAASEAIMRDPHYERAYYNRACYKSLVNAPVDEILDDLGQAVRLYKLNGVWAQSDSDFATIRSDKRFQSIVDGAEARAAAV